MAKVTGVTDAQGKACATSMTLEEYMATSFVSAASTRTSAKVR